MHIEIERLTEATIPEADAVLTAAYRSPSRAAELRRYLTLQPDGWRLARVDSRAAGAGGAVDYGPFAYVGLVGVLPEYHRRGIATAVMRDLLGWLDARGCPCVVLDASADGAHLYPGMGFVADDTVGVWRREETPAQGRGGPGTDRDVAEEGRGGPRDHEGEAAGGGPGGEWEGTVRALTPADLNEVCAFDAPLFGADRRAVLALCLAEMPGRAFVARDATGAVAGFLFAQPLNIGPWVATTRAAAEALLAAALALPFAGPPQVLAPAANPHAAAVLGAAGFAPTRTLQHMRRGGAPLLARRRTLYGQASFALG